MSKKNVSLDISIEDNTSLTKKELEDAIAQILESIGTEAEGFAKDETPVNTGRLRNSITWATKANEGRQFTYSDENGLAFEDAVGTGVDAYTVVIGTNVEYARKIEDGIRGRRGVHMLRNAVANHGDRYKALAEAVLKSKK